MVGYRLEFKRAHNPIITEEPGEMIEIGQINAQHVHEWTGAEVVDSTPMGNLEQVAAQVQPPRISQNFLAPVNDTTNRRCQEWTMDFVRRLVAINYLERSSLDKVQARRDPPTHGIFALQGGLGRGDGQPDQQAPVQQQAPAQQQAAVQQQAPQHQA
ncbi:hypothetical protein CC80DRAFT_539192 [Byssothecium circinans]|uniref:Uncharacterized protein n=1 Tax=Byssothecium circinans TaxID=147558 RepID=A0A6A5TE55_9PLEO|nr:hypothetical protein CC80DRAFT_539192 [Byssothecium circinans]